MRNYAHTRSSHALGCVRRAQTCFGGTPAQQLSLAPSRPVSQPRPSCRPPCRSSHGPSQVSGDAKYLSKADWVVRQMLEVHGAWNGTCGGGVYWGIGHYYKNT